MVGNEDKGRHHFKIKCLCIFEKCHYSKEHWHVVGNEDKGRHHLKIKCLYVCQGKVIIIQKNTGI